MLHRLRFPSRALRERIAELVTIAYDTEEHEPLYEAADIVTQFYGLATVRRFVFRRRFREQILGRCWQSGWIEILHPATAKARGNERAAWVQAVLHELGHYVFWVDDERRADAFAARLMR